MRFVVTGGAGFIGSHVCDALVARGDRVVVLDDLSTGSLDNLASMLGDERLEVVEGSVLDAPLVARLVGRADVVIHLAAAVGVRLIVDEPLHSMTTNIKGTENVLEAARAGRQRVLITSTSEVYGKNTEPVNQFSERILGPTSVDRWSYSVAKAVDEIYAFAYWRELGVPTVVVRLFNTVGPRQTGAYGMVIPRLVAQALLGDDLTVYGDGTQTRCFCHVSDVVRALLALVEAPEAIGQATNVGSDEEITIVELAHRVLEITGSTSKVRLVPFAEAFGPDFEDAPRRVPDTTRLRTLIGWERRLAVDDIIADVASSVSDGDPADLLGRGVRSR